MMEVPVNIIPFGDTEGTYNIGKLLLCNTLEEGRGGRILYRGAFFRDDGLELERFTQCWHKREDGAWKLIQLLIESDIEVPLEELPDRVANWYLNQDQE